MSDQQLRSTEQQALQHLAEIRARLQLPTKTEIWLGPKDRVIKGKEYQQKFLGTLASLSTATP